MYACVVCYLPSNCILLACIYNPYSYVCMCFIIISSVLAEVGINYHESIDVIMYVQSFRNVMVQCCLQNCPVLHLVS